MSMNDLASPVGAFVRQECTRDSAREVMCEELYAAYGDWCERNGRRKKALQVFGRDLTGCRAWAEDR